jgi:copper(I)-binding protein
MKRKAFLSAGLYLVLAAACTPAPSGGGGAGGTAGVAATDVWARAAATGNSAAYMILKNGGAADRLVKAESDVAGVVELHKTTMDGGMMKMAPVDGIDLPAQGQAELKPGGLHVMLIGLKREMKAGEKLKLKLYFEKAGVQEIEAEVRK